MIFSNRVFVFSNKIEASFWGDSANRIVRKKKGRKKERKHKKKK